MDTKTPQPQNSLAAQNILNLTPSEWLRENVIPYLGQDRIYNQMDHAFKEGSGRWRGLPPFRHSNSGTSFAVFKDTLRFLDGGTGETGDAIKYRYSMQVGYFSNPTRQDFWNTFNQLCQEAGLENPFKTGNWDSRKHDRQHILEEVFKICRANLQSVDGAGMRQLLEEDKYFTKESLLQLEIGLYNYKKVTEHLKSCGFNMEFVKACGVLNKKFDGYALFPWRDIHGDPLTYYGHLPKALRVDGKQKKLALSNPRFEGEIWLKSKQAPYLLNRALTNHHDEVVIVEGITDAAIAHQEGDTSVIAIVAACMSAEQQATLRKCKNIERVVIALDPDEAGNMAVPKLIQQIAQMGKEPFVMTIPTDPDEFIRPDANTCQIDKWLEAKRNAIHGYRWSLNEIVSNIADPKSDRGRSQLITKCRQFIDRVKYSDQIITHFIPHVANVLDMEPSECHALFNKSIQQSQIQYNSSQENHGSSFVNPLLGENNPWDEHNLPSINESSILERLLPLLHNKIRWKSDISTWMRYNPNVGFWEVSDSNEILRDISFHIFALREKYSEIGATFEFESRLINGLLVFVRAHLSQKKWNSNPDKIAFKNNVVLNIKTREITQYDWEDYLTWGMPHVYSTDAKCPKILDWLQETYDENTINILKAYLAACLTGNTSAQRHLELIGRGGTGKGTFIRLATMLVGEENTLTTNLKDLENNRFESSLLFGKRLAVITDSDRYAGSVGVLKAIVGQDKIRFEQKYKQATEGFTPEALLIIAANEPIASADYSSGIMRRRLSVYMDKLVPNHKRRSLLEKYRDEWIGEFASEAGGLINWVLELDYDAIRNNLTNAEKISPFLLNNQVKTICATNPLAMWASQKLIIDPQSFTPIGEAKREKNNELPNQFMYSDRLLYANYCEHAIATNSMKLGLSRWSNLFIDLINVQLTLLGTEIKLVRHPEFGTCIKGVRIRTINDTDPYMFDEVNDIPLIDSYGNIISEPNQIIQVSSTTISESNTVSDTLSITQPESIQLTLPTTTKPANQSDTANINQTIPQTKPTTQTQDTIQESETQNLQQTNASSSNNANIAEHNTEAESQNNEPYAKSYPDETETNQLAEKPIENKSDTQTQQPNPQNNLEDTPILEVQTESGYYRVGDYVIVNSTVVQITKFLADSRVGIEGENIYGSVHLTDLKGHASTRKPENHTD